MYRKLLLCLVICLTAVLSFSHSLAGDVSILGSLFSLKAEPLPQIEVEDLRPAAVQEPESPPEEANFKYAQVILPTAEKYGMDWRLIAAVIQAESGFSARAVSPRGAVGLMQVMPSTAALYRVKRVDLYDPQKNVDVGVRHLKMLHDRYSGDLKLVLAAYNSGEVAVDKYHGVPPYKATQAFVRQVLQHYSASQLAMQGGVPAGSKVR